MRLLKKIIGKAQDAGKTFNNCVFIDFIFEKEEGDDYEGIEKYIRKRWKREITPIAIITGKVWKRYVLTVCYKCPVPVKRFCQAKREAEVYCGIFNKWIEEYLA